MKKWIIAVVVVLCLLAGWMYFAFASLVSAERDLLARLDAIVQYYVSMDTDYVQPLMTTTSLSESDRESLAAISAQLRALASHTDSSDQLTKLLDVQRSTIAFFTNPALSEQLTLDSRYAQWNKNASNQGHASELVRDYNVALSLYNAQLRTPAGKIASFWHTVEHRAYLGINGLLEAETKITF